MSNPTDTLAALEAPKNRLTHARQDRATLNGAGEPASDVLKAAMASVIIAADGEVAQAETALAQHQADNGGAEALARKIAQASQDVLDARGEAHTDQDFIKGPDTDAE
jgi:hypothetical protein